MFSEAHNFTDFSTMESFTHSKQQTNNNNKKLTMTNYSASHVTRGWGDNKLKKVKFLFSRSVESGKGYLITLFQ